MSWCTYCHEREVFPRLKRFLLQLKSKMDPIEMVMNESPKHRYHIKIYFIRVTASDGSKTHNIWNCDNCRVISIWNKWVALIDNARYKSFSHKHETWLGAFVGDSPRRKISLVGEKSMKIRKNQPLLTAMVIQFSSCPCGNFTTNLEPALSSESFSGRNLQTTLILSSAGISRSAAAIIAR